MRSIPAITRNVLLLLLLLNAAHPLTLQAGQRIPSRAIVENAATTTVPQNSIFDLPRVEQWASERGLREHHLKIIYHVAMHSRDLDDDNLDEKLALADFPHKHAVAFAADFSLCTSRIVETTPSASGGQKLVVELPSGLLVETVIIRHDRRTKKDSRYTVCVSSQVGCAKACSFCATGSMGLLSNLSSAEILEQVWLARKLLAEHKTDLRNVVFMGMGEPLDNYDAVHEACRGLTHQCLFGFRSKHVTISTVGDTPERIRQLADEAPQISLALSLHGATQQLRSTLIPTAKPAPLKQLEKALDYHASKSGRGAMLEYLLIDGVNDSDDAADALVKFCLDRASVGRTRPFVNLIPYNPTLAGGSFGYRTPADDRIEGFHKLLRSEGINSLVRWTSASGRDADGACGQLALSVSGKKDGTVLESR